MNASDTVTRPCLASEVSLQLVPSPCVRDGSTTSKSRELPCGEPVRVGELNRPLLDPNTFLRSPALMSVRLGWSPADRTERLTE